MVGNTMWATSPTKFSSDPRTSSGAHQNVPIETSGLRYNGVIRTRSPSPACQVARRSGGRTGSATNTIGADPRRAREPPDALAGEAVLLRDRGVGEKLFGGPLVGRRAVVGDQFGSAHEVGRGRADLAADQHEV